MSYQVLARKWRPKNFQEMVGQEHVIKVLSHALDHNRIHHAFLFTGTRGVGKTTLGRILAKALNCQKGVSSNPCCECDHCLDIDAGRFFDLIEVDAASRTKVDDTREMLENVQYMPAHGRYKIYLIDEVHMLSTHSFNALLKTLEEPPPHVKFLLATTDPQKLPVTILSRCLQFHLKALTVEQIQAHLQTLLQHEAISYQPEAIKWIARAAEGSVRDSLSLLDQAISMGDGEVVESEVQEMLGVIEQHYYFDLLDALARRDGDALLAVSAQISELSVNFADVLTGMIDTLYLMALVQTVPTALTEELGDKSRIEALASQISAGDVQLYYQIALNGRHDLTLVPHPKVGFEMVLLRMLAFTPHQEEEHSATSSTPPPSKASRPSRTEAPPQSRPRRAASDSSAPSKASAPSRSDRSQRAPSASSASSASAEKREPSELLREWEKVISELDMEPLAMQFARNCSVKALKEGVLTLAFEEKMALIGNTERVQKIQNLLTQRYGAPITIQLISKSELKDSPASIEKAERAERHSQAQQSLLDDPVVQAAQEKLGAALDPQSVTPNPSS